MRDDTEHLDAQSLEEDLAPHSKQNMTSPFGRFVDRATYTDILILVGFVLIASSSYLWMAPSGHGLKEPPPTRWEFSYFLECAYFTLVTFTSLGYGEVLPIGFGRVVAVADVLSGLALTAVLIGKVASERQSSILLLLHTSDTQRRIADFSKELKLFRNSLQDALHNKDINDLKDILDLHMRFTKGIKNYLMFNSHQAAVAEFGNFTALIGLYDEIKESFDLLSEIHKSANEIGSARVMNRSFTNMNSLYQIVRRMDAVHQRGKGRDPIWRNALRAAGLIGPIEPSTSEQSARSRLRVLKENMDAHLKTALAWVENGYHPVQIERVFDAFPAGPRSDWPTGIHKTVAKKLGISNTIASHCVGHLLKANRLPKIGKSPVTDETTTRA